MISDTRNSVSCSRPFVALTTIAPGADERRGALAGSSRVPCDGTAAHDELGAAQRLVEVRGDAQPVGKRDVRQVHRIRAARAHVGDQRGIARPQHGSWPARARCTASAVPHPPAPRTATCESPPSPALHREQPLPDAPFGAGDAAAPGWRDGGEHDDAATDTLAPTATTARSVGRLPSTTASVTAAASEPTEM